MTDNAVKRVYISGPMTGLPEHNRPAFEAARDSLAALGYEVLSPTDAPECDSWEAYMRWDIRLLMTADLVAMLPDWHLSRRAGIERYLADGIGIPVYKLSTVLKLSTVGGGIWRDGPMARAGEK